ncbi:MAG: acyltransferase [Dissulfurispiraceae bacterium]
MTTIENNQVYQSTTPERISFLDNLRAIAIVMVVGVHTLGYCVPLPQYHKEILIFIMQTISVPVFFLVDGYLLAQSVIKSESYSYYRYVRKSLFRLLAPWVFFTLTYTLARYAFELTGFFKERLILGHSFLEIATSAYGSVYAPQMYFLFSLFVIRLCSPMFKKILSIKNHYILLLLFFCYYAAYKLTINSISPYLRIAGGQEPVLHALWGLQYYLVGICCFKISEIVELKKLFIPFLSLFISALLIQSHLGLYWFNIDQYLYLLTIFTFFAFLKNGFPLLNVIGKNTMGIYLIHAPIVLKGVSLILNKFVADPLLSFASVLICTFVLTLCIVMIINSIPYGCLLFGTPYQQNTRLSVTPYKA